MIKEININVQGNFSNIHTKDEYNFLSKEYVGGIMHYNCKVRKTKNKRFTVNTTLCGSSFIINDSKSIYFNGSFIGNIKEVEGGFIPCESITNYYGKRIYKTFEDAKRELINKKYRKLEKASFSLLAKKKFYYTKNYLEGLSISQMAEIVNPFTNNMKLAIKIVKKFLRSDIIGYYGQGGYKTKTQVVC